MSKLSAAIHNNVTKNRSGRLAKFVIAASMTVASGHAFSAVVCGTTSLPAAVPASTAGLYINFVTGVVGTPASAVAGWDFNPFGTSALSFFTTTTATNIAAIAGGGTGATSPTVLTAGATIGPALTYLATGSGTNPAWRAGVSGQYVGVRFNNEVTVATNYGWVQMNTTGPNGVPATVLAYCYDNTGAAITAGTTPVSLQKFSVD